MGTCTLCPELCAERSNYILVTKSIFSDQDDIRMYIYKYYRAFSNQNVVIDPYT